jgi:hypothetical protein
MAAPKILVPFPRVRKKGTVGRDVQQDRRALTRAGVWPVNTKTTPHSYYDSPQFTHKFALAVREYQRRQKLPITGEMDRATHNRLARPYRSKNGSLHAFGFYGGAGAKVMEDVQKKLIAQERYLLNSGSVTQRGVAAALMCVRHRDAIHYTQGGLRMQGVNRRLYPPDYPHYGDCSAMATWWYFVAGAPDPNGLGYTGVGYTGTQAPRGSARSSWNAPAMALVFYGSGRTIKHVAMKVKPSLVVSHGSEIGPVLVSVGYRPPIVCKVFNLNVRPGFRPWPVRKAAA